MKDYYTILVDLAQKRILDHDLLNKQELKRHNRVMTQIVKLWKELAVNDMDCNELFYRLLSHENPRVLVVTATICYWINEQKPFSNEILQMAHATVYRIYNDKTMDPEDNSMAFRTILTFIDPSTPSDRGGNHKTNNDVNMREKQMN